MNGLHFIFFSPSEGRLRAGWRLALQTLLLFILAVSFTLLVFMLPPGQSPRTMFLISQLSELAAITLSVYLARRYLDRQTFISLGLKLSRQGALDVAVGLGMTSVMLSLIFAIEWAAGWLTLEGFAWEIDTPSTLFNSTLLFLFMFLVVAWKEELLSRGYHLQTLASGLNLFWGALLSSAFFGVLHLGNPNATWLSALGAALAGLLLAYAYIRTRQLWLPMGLHLGWNFFEGVVFGFPVSGLETYSLLRITVDGPVTWTGGGFGPEAGLVVLPGLALGAALIYAYTLRRGESE